MKKLLTSEMNSAFTTPIKNKIFLAAHYCGALIDLIDGWDSIKFDLILMGFDLMRFDLIRFWFD